MLPPIHMPAKKKNSTSPEVQDNLTIAYQHSPFHLFPNVLWDLGEFYQYYFPQKLLFSPNKQKHSFFSTNFSLTILVVNKIFCCLKMKSVENILRYLRRQSLVNTSKYPKQFHLKLKPDLSRKTRALLMSDGSWRF